MKKIKIGCITFHASHNYGSNLQAYALQQYVKSIADVDYEIINLRTKIQKDIYNTCFNRKGLKPFIKRCLYFKYKDYLLLKYKRYEEFISNSLNITKELEKIDKNCDLNYDYYLSGSDQIWNLDPIDFEWSYFLEFVNKGKRISYSASFGPKFQSCSASDYERVKKNLLKYEHISVREKGSYDNVKLLTGIEANINIDPTLLLSKDEWKKLISSQPFQKGDYIFLYDLKKKKETYNLAKKISRLLNMPIVVCSENIYSIRNNFIKRFDAGPKEFINLIYYSKLTLSTSFHGNVFSIIFNKPFYAVNSENDLRISNLLNLLGLKDRFINCDNYQEKIKNYDKIDFTVAKDKIAKEIIKSKRYLLMCLDMVEGEEIE